MQYTKLIMSLLSVGLWASLWGGPPLSPTEEADKIIKSGGVHRFKLSGNKLAYQTRDSSFSFQLKGSSAWEVVQTCTFDHIVPAGYAALCGIIYGTIRIVGGRDMAPTVSVTFNSRPTEQCAPEVITAAWVSAASSITPVAPVLPAKVAPAIPIAAPAIAPRWGGISRSTLIGGAAALGIAALCVGAATGKVKIPEAVSRLMS